MKDARLFGAEFNSLILQFYFRKDFNPKLPPNLKPG